MHTQTHSSLGLLEQFPTTTVYLIFKMSAQANWNRVLLVLLLRHLVKLLSDICLSQSWNLPSALKNIQ